MTSTLENLAAGLGFLLASCAALGAETQPPAPKPEEPAARPVDSVRLAACVAKLGSDAWTEREAAMEALLAEGAEAASRLEKIVRETEDPEVRTRMERVLAVLRAAPVQGTYVQSSKKTLDAAGNERPDNDDTSGHLSIEGGKAIWTRVYPGNQTVVQTFALALERPLRFEGEFEAPLVFQEMTTQIGYSPESENARLKLRRTPEGLKLTFTGTDGMGNTSSVEFEAETKK